MKSTTISLAIIAVLCVGAAPLSRAADQPFIGKWKLNLSKSKLADQMTIAPAGANRYTLTFAGVGDTETLLADGTDQPGILGSTISITVEAPGNWKIVRKQGGRTLLTANWKLSDGGHALPATSARSLGDRSIELTKKLKGKIVETREITISPDLKTLTMTRHLVDQRIPNILIFDRA